MAAIRCESVTKKFKEMTVVRDITMNVEENAIFGVLGLDSSGKTTLLKLLTGLLKPTSGSVHLFDRNVSKNPVQALQGVGCLVGEPAFYENFTAEENLYMIANLLDTEADEVIESVGITFENVLVRNLTRAMRKQLAIAAALVGNPRLLLLDEPLANLAAQTRSKILTLLSELEETTILFTTYSPEDIKDLAEEAVVLKKGEIAALGSVSKLDLRLEVDT